MIELPEASVIAKQLREVILNKVIVAVIVKHSPHSFAFFNEDIDYQTELLNNYAKSACNHAGIIEIQFNDCFLTLRDGANVRYYTDENKLPKKHQLLLKFEDNTYLVVSVQMYGEIYLTKENREGDFYYQICKLNSNPTKDDFTFDYFASLLNNCESKISIKAALATEQRIPGIGNGVLQDILFKSKLNPKNKVSTLNEEDRIRLYNVLVKTIGEMIEKGGRNTEKDLFNNIGGYEVILSSKTYKNGCPICHNEIVKQAYLGGSVYYCLIDQPLIR